MSDIIRTIEQLRQYASEVSSREITDDDLIWFICYQNARLMFDSYTTKDLARELRDGIEPTNDIIAVQEYLNTLYDDQDEQYCEEVCRDLKAQIRDMWS